MRGNVASLRRKTLFFAAILWRRISGKWLKIDRHCFAWWFFAIRDFEIDACVSRNISIKTSFRREKCNAVRVLSSNHECWNRETRLHYYAHYFSRSPVRGTRSNKKICWECGKHIAPHTARTVLRLRSSTCAYIAVWNASFVT